MIRDVLGVFLIVFRPDFLILKAQMDLKKGLKNN